MKKLLKFISLAAVAVLVFTACEGPMGPTGPIGEKGPEGPRGEKGDDALCSVCHYSANVQKITHDYDYFSAHGTGDAYTHGNRTACAPCHTNAGFLYMRGESPNAAYAVKAEPITCKACHADYHKDGYEWGPTTLTTVAEVPMVMYGGTKTINFTGNAASSNLCATCHQPRAVNKTGGGVINYDLLASNPNDTYNQSVIEYRFGIHYSPEGALYAGVGGIQFGDWSEHRHSSHVRNNSVSCATCHLAMTDEDDGPEGHTFAATTKACNIACHHHDGEDLDARIALLGVEIDGLIGQLADKLNAIGSGHDILKKEDDGKYHGYLNIYSVSENNLNGYFMNPSEGNVPFPTLTNAQVGALINFQLIVRGASGKAGAAHNYPYVKRLIENSIAAI
ncbi:MAG: collagen-like protein [Bacteroidales bacterium]|jgi:hypothetical protein|nr:collagen-like protein [Bacteroidales bacterium]